MEAYPREIEVERLSNLAKTFGWEVVKQEIIEEDLHITFKKRFPAPVEVVAEGEAG